MIRIARASERDRLGRGEAVYASTRRAFRDAARAHRTTLEIDPFGRAALLAVADLDSERPFARLVQRDAQRGLGPKRWSGIVLPPSSRKKPKLGFRYRQGRSPPVSAAARRPHRPGPASSGRAGGRSGSRSQAFAESRFGSTPAATSWCARLASKVRNGPRRHRRPGGTSTGSGAGGRPQERVVREVRLPGPWSMNQLGKLRRRILACPTSAPRRGRRHPAKT